YAIIRTAVKQALGKFNIAPTLDFEQEKSFDIPLSKYKEEVKIPTIRVNPNFNPFEKEKQTFSPSQKTINKNATSWENLYDNFEENTKAISHAQSIKNSEDTPTQTEQLFTSNWDEEFETKTKTVVQIHQKFILTQLNNNHLFIDQQRAHERILFEKFLTHLENGNGHSQQLLFPETIELSNADAELIREIEPDIKKLGFNFNAIGRTAFIINGVPVELSNQPIQHSFENLLEQFKHHQAELKLVQTEGIAMAIARSASIKSGQVLNQEEMLHLIEQLFACQMPYSLPNGKPILISLDVEYLNQQFNY
ncbi:MAG: DNA mismatch repair protein MutL, partial [Flavobacteriales bacterium]|nr:DNA mismatch repair protein MutL [Flavobacteriales bacterium]